MKAVVVEIKDNIAAALSDDGCVYKVKNNNYMIGQEIKMKKQILNKEFIKLISSVAAAMAILVVPAWAYYTPYSYVSIDINPSVEYSVNRFDRVLNVKAVNDDGKEILKEINLESLKNKNIKEAVDVVLNEIIEEGFFVEGEDGGIVVATSSKNKEKNEELTASLKSTVEEKVKKDAAESNVHVEAVSVGEERVQVAKELGVTPGKLNLVQKLQESAENPDDINIEEWLDKPVKEIMKATKEYKKTENLSYKDKDIDKAIDDEDSNSENVEIKNKDNKDNKEIKEIKGSKDNKSDKDNTEVEDIIEIKDLECTITSIDKKNSSITVFLSTQKTITVYFDENTTIQDSKGKDMNFNSLKINDKTRMDLEYKNEKFNANEVKTVIR